METTPINFVEKLALFAEHWSPRIIAQMNNYHFKLAKVQGTFTWHSHPETDEAFIVLAGRLRIEYRQEDGATGAVKLSPGELFVVPRHVQHRPVAEQECHLLLIEPAGTVNTGDVVSAHTTTVDTWI
jgi:mannose-6-phosphate isomerase-like protein (cupin superfamily)